MCLVGGLLVFLVLVDLGEMVVLCVFECCDEVSEVYCVGVIWFLCNVFVVDMK